MEEFQKEEKEENEINYLMDIIMPHLMEQQQQQQQ